MTLKVQDSDLCFLLQTVRAVLEPMHEDSTHKMITFVSLKIQISVELTINKSKKHNFSCL